MSQIGIYLLPKRKFMDGSEWKGKKLIIINRITNRIMLGMQFDVYN